MGDLRRKLLQLNRSKAKMQKRKFRGGFDGTEWRCLMCNQINLARNTACYRCGVEKRKAEAQQNQKKLVQLQKLKALSMIEKLNEKMKDKEKREEEEPVEAESRKEDEKPASPDQERP